MIKKILFLAPYPTNINIKEGMMSRVKAIDSQFIEIERTYLNVSIRNFNKQKYKDGIVSVYNLNLLLHFITILRILKLHNIIYSHSIYMMRFIWMFLDKTKKLVLDVHGVVPEEQRDFKGTYFNVLYYSFIEKVIFKKLDTVICVTNSMKKHYNNKYPWFKGNFIIYRIIPDFLTRITENDLNVIEKKNINKINVLYSGGSQLWQNIDLMLQTIKENQFYNMHFTILTGEPDFFIKKCKQNNIKSEFITIASRSPHELWQDYLTADYAFILRDHNVVNNVASPTKLTEYMYYGLIPIVLSPNIGDYKELGYEYIALKNFNEKLVKPKSRSVKNIVIIKKLIQENKKLNIKQILISE